jgi:ribosomal protein S18 acetylase RimI-like enzyme
MEAAALTLRLFTVEDLDATVRMWIETKRVAYPYLPLEQGYTFDDNRNFFADHIVPRCEIWLALDGDSIRGFLALDDSYIDRLYVAVDRQRRGVGEVLLTQARERSPDRLWLHTHQKNTQARAFYEKHDFRAAKFGISPAPESEPDVEYRWQP